MYKIYCNFLIRIWKSDGTFFLIFYVSSVEDDNILFWSDSEESSSMADVGMVFFSYGSIPSEYGI